MIPRAYPLRMLVDSDAVGAIIGRSGSTIQSITQQTEAKIDVHREDSPDQHEKVITINGTEDACSEACHRIIKIVQSEINIGCSIQGAPVTLDTNRDVTLKILASGNLIGRLIGKSGSTIKKIMEQTSTRVNISTNSITESTGEHTIAIVGKLENIRQAERLISSKLRADYCSDMNTSLQTMSQQPYLYNNVLLPFMPNPYAQNSILASIVNPQSGHGGGASAACSGTGAVPNTMPRSMPMSPNNQGQLQNSIYTATAPGYLAMYPNASLPQAAPGLLGFNPVTSGYDQERETVFIHIPSGMVGAIIGKSGAAIKEMISTSGAMIKVATIPVVSELESNQHKEEPKVTNSEPNSNSNSEDTSSQNGPADGTTATTGPGPGLKVSRYQGGPYDSSQQSPTRRVTIMGYPASQYSAQYMIFRKISFESKSDISLMVEIYVPSHVVGRIIGKGGSTVKGLQKMTRTIIRLPDDKTTSQAQAAANTGETCVQITGNFEGSQSAQRHIRNMVRESLYLRRTRLQQQARNNESILAKNNNAQKNNHQEGDNEHENSVLSNADDKTTNEKSTDKTVHGCPSMSCNDDLQKKRQEEKSHANSSAVRCDERNGADNNNTIINNLNSSSKPSVKEMRHKEQTSDATNTDECIAGAEWRS